MEVESSFRHYNAATGDHHSFIEAASLMKMNELNRTNWACVQFSWTKIRFKGNYGDHVANIEAVVNTRRYEPSPSLLSSYLLAQNVVRNVDAKVPSSRCEHDYAAIKRVTVTSAWLRYTECSAEPMETHYKSAFCWSSKGMHLSGTGQKKLGNWDVQKAYAIVSL